MGPDNKIIDLPVKQERSGRRGRLIGPARIIIFPGVRIDRNGADPAGTFGPVRRRPSPSSAHAVEEEKR